MNSYRVEVSCFLEAYSLEYPREKWISLEADLRSQEEFHHELAPGMTVVGQAVRFLEVGLMTGDNVLDEQ